MSRSTNCTLTCPCGEVFSASIYDYVNVAKDPQLQYTVLAGLLNVASCPSCGRRAAIAHPFVYSDLAHCLLVYVHPQADVPEETRSLLLEKLRTVYVNSVNTQAATLEQQLVNGQKQHEEVSENGTAETHRRQTPPLQVVFGLDQLYELINTTLSQDERLGRLALSTHSRSDAERGQLLTIARKLASEMQCQIEVEDMPDEYTVWLYGSRRQIGALMRELAPRG
jgi:CpXC motif protein